MSTLKVSTIEPLDSDTTNTITIGSAGDTIAFTGTTTGVGKIGQTLQTTVTEASFTSASTSFTTITGLTVAITPSASSSKVLVDFDICGGVDAYNGVTAFRLMRDSTPIYIADSATNYTQSTHGGLRGSLDDNSGFLVNIKYMDSPSTASQVVYSVQVRSESASYTYKLNRMGNDTSGQGYSFRSASNVIAQEVLAWHQLLE